MKHVISIYKNETGCHAVCNKMALDLTQDGLKDFKNFEKVLISKTILFKKINGRIYKVSIEAANICNILPKPAVSNGLVVFKLKQDLTYRSDVYFKPVYPQIYQELPYLKSHNKFYENFSVAKRLSSEKMLRFPDIIETLHQMW